MRISLPLALAALLGLASTGLLIGQDENPLKLQDPDALNADKDKVTLEPGTTPDISLGEGPTAPPVDEKINLNELLNDASASEKKVLDKLSVEDKKRLSKLLAEASAYVAGIRIQEAFERLFEAVDIAPDLFSVHNLLGAAYTKMRDFEKARVSFAKAVELAPRAFMARFNVTELDFVEGKFEDAIAGFAPLITQLEQEIATLKEIVEDPRRPLTDTDRKNLRLRITATQTTIKLIKFKLLISNLKLGKMDEAQAIQDEFHFLDDTPGYYYGNAAKEFHLSDLAKKKKDEKASKKHTEEAQGWLRSAEKIYDRQQLEIYTDSFIEVGWIENLQ